MALDVSEWLRGLGFERYDAAFRENDIDEAVLPRLTTEDLREIGIASVGHRRRLIEAIAALETPATATSLVDRDDPAITVAASPERRQLTVMFVDLVGSTPLAAQLDPEDLRDVIGAYHRCVAEAVGRFGGFVAKYMGDGILVYFGYPLAREDDAERAVAAGLAVVDAVAALPRRGEAALACRVGIATGLVVVGDLIGAGAAQEQAVVGETPNLAARLQALAAANAVLIGERTRRLIGGLFEMEPLGPLHLAGFPEPQHAWRVLGESGVISRFEALRSEAAPLVGRDDDLELLLHRWQQAKAGEGRVVLLSGEAGIGKSRLIATLSQRVKGEPHARLRYFCTPQHQDSPLHPFVVQLERAAGFARNDSAESRLAKLHALLAPAATGEHDLALLAELLSLPNAATGLALSPQRKRELLFEALLRQFETVAHSRPVLMIFEDAHWIDPTSRDLLDLTLERAPRLPVLILVTFRPEFTHAWAGQPRVTTLTLNRLTARDGAALVERLAGSTGLSREAVDEIVERTDGVPLFVEELTKAVLEHGVAADRVAAVLATTPSPELPIPATLHASLIARLDRLGPAAREVAQIGAVLGRDFGYDLLEHVARLPEGELAAALDRLVAAGLLFRRGVAPQTSYLFKHALVQDAAYGILLRARRQELHARIAAALKRHFADLIERQPELLAHHLTAVGEPSGQSTSGYGPASAPRSETRISKRSAISTAGWRC
jgi:class 3 adenylate cyclase